MRKRTMQRITRRKILTWIRTLQRPSRRDCARSSSKRSVRPRKVM
ncbi:hypothetical protein L916_14121 [Phytophthora nicotianae]|uniref:Uncharacterized protein n=1 Tax=Phytophthora nicotianae TaxID=4792 RepID=W2IJ57_PHYNI|nr:hypothetical protein L916_14121 [Phytophthora nicotianae]